MSVCIGVETRVALLTEDENSFIAGTVTEVAKRHVGETVLDIVSRSKKGVVTVCNGIDVANYFLLTISMVFSSTAIETFVTVKDFHVNFVGSVSVKKGFSLLLNFESFSCIILDVEGISSVRIFSHV